jgi:hypothetical protein
MGYLYLYPPVRQFETIRLEAEQQARLWRERRRATAGRAGRERASARAVVATWLRPGGRGAAQDLAATCACSRGAR